MLESWNHTMQVRNGEETYRCCSFKDSPLKECPWKSVHKAKLLGTLEFTNAVVKVSRGQNLNTKNRYARAEVKKHNLVREVLPQCQGSQGLCLVRTFHSVVDKVGQRGRLKKMFTKDGHRHVCEGDSVVVQDFVKGQVQQLFVLTENQTSPRSGITSTSTSHILPSCLLQLVTLAYIHSGYTCVIGAVKGVVVHNPRNRRRVTYHLTSFTLHSLDCRFGDNDLGMLGLQMFQHWSGITPRISPVPAPPSSRFRIDDKEESDSRARADNVLNRALCSRPSQLAARRTDNASPSAPPWESSRQCSEGRISALSDGQDPACGGDREDGGPRPVVRRKTLADVLAVCPQMRADYSESFLTSLLGPAPSYSFVC